MDLIRIDKEKCTQCQACINICPVRAINLESEKGFPWIIHERCIGCGSCLGVCADNAISYRSSKQEVNELLKQEEKVAAIVDPSISGEFGDITDYRKFVEMIRALGFEYVGEVSFGVDLVAKAYHELFNNFRGKYYLMANCPALVAYVEKFHPDLIENLAPIVSPMIATALVMRKKYGQNLKIVFIGPCIATKEEAGRYNGQAHVESVLTFKELRELFHENKIDESRLEFSDFDPPIGYKGSLYPLSNGILQAGEISENLLDGTVVTTEGNRNMVHAVKQFENHTEQINKHFNIFYNEGCLMGPGTSPRGEKFLRRSLVIDYANKRLKDFDYKQWQEHMNAYINLDLKTSFKNDDQRIAEPGKEKVNEILKLIGRKSGDNLGCESCGFENCGELARAVAKGLAKPGMCFTFSLKSKDDFIKSLKQTNQKLTGTVTDLRDSEKTARREERQAREQSERLSEMLQQLPSGIVIVEKSLKVVQSNQAFIDMLGEDARMIDEVIPGLAGADLKNLLPADIVRIFSNVLDNNTNVMDRDVHYENRLLNISVFTILKGKLAGAVFRDLYVPEMRREQVIKRVSEVINQNLEMVQKIGFLLGEGASTTEQMLNSIIESYKSQDKDDTNIRSTNKGQ